MPNNSSKLLSLRKSLQDIKDNIRFLEAQTSELNNLKSMRHRIEDEIFLMEQGQMQLEGNQFFDRRVMPTDWVQNDTLD